MWISKRDKKAMRKSLVESLDALDRLYRELGGPGYQILHTNAERESKTVEGLISQLSWDVCNIQRASFDLRSRAEGYKRRSDLVEGLNLDGDTPIFVMAKPISDSYIEPDIIFFKCSLCNKKVRKSALEIHAQGQHDSRIYSVLNTYEPLKKDE